MATKNAVNNTGITPLINVIEQAAKEAHSNPVDSTITDPSSSTSAPFNQLFTKSISMANELLSSPFSNESNMTVTENIVNGITALGYKAAGQISSVLNNVSLTLGNTIRKKLQNEARETLITTLNDPSVQIDCKPIYKKGSIPVSKFFGYPIQRVPTTLTLKTQDQKMRTYTIWLEIENPETEGIISNWSNIENIQLLKVEQDLITDSSGLNGNNLKLEIGVVPPSPPPPPPKPGERTQLYYPDPFDQELLDCLNKKDILNKAWKAALGYS